MHVILPESLVDIVDTRVLEYQRLCLLADPVQGRLRRGHRQLRTIRPVQHLTHLAKNKISVTVQHSAEDGYSRIVSTTQTEAEARSAHEERPYRAALCLLRRTSCEGLALVRGARTTAKEDSG